LLCFSNKYVVLYRGTSTAGTHRDFDVSVGAMQMEVNPNAVGIEFIAYEYISKISNTNFMRLHAFDWLFLALKDIFVVRYIPDWCDFTPVAIKLRASDADAWVPLTLKSQTYRPNEDNSLQGGNNRPLRGLFEENSIYKHHVVMCVFVSNIAEAVKEETFRAWGGNLPEDWTGRFNTYPIEMATAYTHDGDFHPTEPAILYANKVLSDPTPVVFPTEPPAEYVNALNEVVQKVRGAVENRYQTGNIFKWDELNIAPLLRAKQVERERYQKMMDHCGKGPCGKDPFMAYATMRNGPVDFAFLRKYCGPPQSIAVQMKSFPGINWGEMMVDVGNVVLVADIKIDILLLINEFAESMDIYFVKWDYFKREIDRARAKEEGKMHASELIDEHLICKTAGLNEQTEVSVMTFQKHDDIKEDARAADRIANNTILCAHLDRLFRPLTLREELIVDAGKYII